MLVRFGSGFCGGPNMGLVVASVLGGDWWWSEDEGDDGGLMLVTGFWLGLVTGVLSSCTRLFSLCQISTTADTLVNRRRDLLLSSAADPLPSGLGWWVCCI
ncbi:hypothetical protein Q3G72_029549 [Acer saccharum]|nr:hypothetical protein Q3G72_029549 [Acer saccharum]